MLTKKEIIKYDKIKYQNHSNYDLVFLGGEVTKDEESISFEMFEDNAITEIGYEDDYFYQLNINRFKDILLLEFIKLGDDKGFYKDWSYRKFMESLKEVCDSVDCVYINNYDKEGEIIVILDENDGRVRYKHLGRGKNGKLYAVGKVHDVTDRVFYKGHYHPGKIDFRNNVPILNETASGAPHCLGKVPPGQQRG